MATIILRCKDTNDKGILYIQQIKEGRKKIKSLSVEMSKRDFIKHYVKKLNQFTPSKSFDATILNKLIEQTIQIDLFKTKEKNNDSLITIWQKFIDIKPEQNKKDNYTSSLKKFKGYLTSINKTDILIGEINITFVSLLKNYLLIEKKNSEITTRQFFALFKRILKYAKSLEVIVPNFDFLSFKELGLGKSTKQRIMPTDTDIKKLFNIQPSDKYFYYANMLRLSIGMGGLRFGDLMFLKYGDLHEKNIKFIASKTKKKQSVSYNNILIDSLYHFIFIEKKEHFKVGYSYHKIDWNIDLNEATTTKFDKSLRGFMNLNAKAEKTDKLKNILDYAKDNPNKFILEKYINSDIFKGYNKLSLMTENQYFEYKRKRTNFNVYLNSLKKHYKLSMPHLTSHFSRYILVALLLEKGTNILIISKLLQHSSLEQTKEYIKKNYDDEHNDKVKNDINEIYSTLI